MRIVFIGAGNVATHMAKRLFEKGCAISQVFSNHIENAKKLAKTLGDTDFTDNLETLDNSADIYIFSVKDSAIKSLLEQYWQKFNKEALFVHTAGSVPMNVFEPYTTTYGVVYPLQTFSKTRFVDFEKIPVFIEANSSESGQRIREIAYLLSDKIYETNSEQRNKIHLSAVFACNFTNHFYEIAGKLTEEIGVPFEVLKPLITETAAKIEVLSPYDAQTGPAARNDELTLNNHLEMLKNNPDWQELYRIISEDIKRCHNN